MSSKTAPLMPADIEGGASPYTVLARFNNGTRALLFLRKPDGRIALANVVIDNFGCVTKVLGATHFLVHRLQEFAAAVEAARVAVGQVPL